MSEINSQTVRTANYRLHQIALKVNASQDHQDDIDLIDDCLKAFQARLEAEEAEEDDEDFVNFDVITADDSEYRRSSIAVVRSDIGRFAVDFDYGGGGSTAAIGQPTAKRAMKLDACGASDGPAGSTITSRKPQTAA